MIVGVAGILIVLFTFGIGVSDADVEADAGAEDVSQWGLPKAAKSASGKRRD